MRLLDPAPLWERLAGLLATDRRALAIRATQIALLGALGAAVAVEMGAGLFNTRSSAEFGFLATPSGTLHPFLFAFVGVLATPLLLAAAFLGLARVYRLPARPLAALVVAVYGSLPVYATLLLMWAPGAILLVCGALMVSLFWWGAGCRILLGVPHDESASFIGLALLATVVATQMLGAILASLI